MIRCEISTMKLSLRRFSGRTGGASWDGASWDDAASGGSSSGVAKNARRTWPVRSGLWVELREGSDRGVGEAAPLPGISSDTLDEAESALSSLDVDRLERAVGIEDTGEALKSVADLLPRSQPAARMALETAALDLRGHQLRVAAAALLGAAPGEEHALAWLVNAEPGTGTLDAVQRARRAGYGHFKIKLGAAGRVETEIATLSELRRALGAGPRLRLDVNQGWSEAEATAACTLLEPLDIEFIEEPCPRLPRRLATRIPVALDESLQGLDPAGLEALASTSGAGVVVLKPMVLGGLSHCLELGRRARAQGLGVVFSHSFDGPVALAAAAALALALPGRLAQGLAPHAGLAAWPSIPLPIVGATLQIWSGPGVGPAAEWLA
jgi:o-succinylbenzoate synthase